MTLHEGGLGLSDVGLTAPPLLGEDARRSRSRFLAGLDIWGPLGFVVLMALACFAWPELYHLRDPTQGNLTAINLPPFSPHYLLGTDPEGYDVLSRLLYGGRVSLEVGFGTTAIGFVIGGTIGILGAYRGGFLEVVLMRVLDVFIAFPPLILAIAVASYLGKSEINVIWAISFFTIPAFARLARAATLKLRVENFVVSARLLGTTTRRIVFRHLLPNVAPQLLTFGLQTVALAIIVEAALSFLGLGIPPPGPSWGSMIASGESLLYTSPALVLIPGLFLLATVLALNLLGDAVRKRWDTL